MDFELEEVKSHFSQLDEMAKDNYQTVTMRDLDLIDWLIEQAEKVERYEKALKYYAKTEALRTPFQRETYGMIATDALKG